MIRLPSCEVVPVFLWSAAQSTTYSNLGYSDRAAHTGRSTCTTTRSSYIISQPYYE